MAKWVADQFRESAIIRNARPESLDDRAQLTAPREWAVLACLALALAAIFVWGVIGSVERTLRLNGVLVLSGERRTLLSGASGEIAEILTRAGERTGRGQALLRVALSGMEWRVRSAAASIRRLENEAQRAAGAAPAETLQLRASVRAMLDELAALQAADEVVSPGDGVVAAILVAPGQTIPAGAPVADVVLGDAGRLEAVAFVGSGESWPFTPGQAARVNVKSGGGSRLLRAKLVSVAPRIATPPRWLARMRPEAAALGAGHILRFEITDARALRPPTGSAPGESLADGTPCRIEIILEHTSPFGLLLRSRGRGGGHGG